MDSKILKYCLFSIFLFIIIENFPAVPIKKTDNIVFCLILILVLVSLDGIQFHDEDSETRITESFNSSNVDSIFEKAYAMYLSIKDKKDTDLSTFNDGYLKDKYSLLEESTSLFTTKNDIKNYFIMKYLSKVASLENVSTKYADALKTQEIVQPIANVTINTSTDNLSEIPEVSQIPEVSESHEIADGNIVVDTTTTTKEDYITKKDAVDIIKHLVSSKSYLENEDYRGNDPAFYTNKGDLIDRSWENQFVVLDTKYWKPCVAPPPACLGKDDSCVPCPTIMHTPYLELKQFDKSRKILN